MDIKVFIQNNLKNLLYSLNYIFEENELAYLSAQCKNELPIRDKIAWNLHKTLNKRYGNDSPYVVRREWAPEGSGRGKVDLAILEMNDEKKTVKRAIALIEFKAQSIARYEKWYIEEFKKDVEKMRELKRNYPQRCKDADLYFVFIEKGQEYLSEKYESILGYVCKSDDVAFYKDINYLSDIEKHWKGFSKALPNEETIGIHQPEAIYIGEAFDCKQYISPLLIGPLK